MKYKAPPSTHACMQTHRAGWVYTKNIIFADSKAGRRRGTPISLEAARRLGKASLSTDAAEMSSSGGRRQTTDKGSGRESETKKQREKRARQIALINLISFKQSELTGAAQMESARTASIVISDGWQREEHLCEGERECTGMQAAKLLHPCVSMLWSAL